jgi:glycosyltransferase involved in cell wall biosynthesis
MIPEVAMRFACFHNSFVIAGGAEILAATQADFLQEQGIEVEVVTFGYDAIRWEKLLGNIPVHLLKNNHWTDVFSAWSRIAKIQRRAERASKALANFDVVLAHNFPVSAMLGAAQIKAKKLWYCHEPPRGIHPREANPILTLRLSENGGEGPENAIKEFKKKLEHYDRELQNNRSVASRQLYDLNQCDAIDVVIANSEFTKTNTEKIYNRADVKVIYPIIRFPDSPFGRSGLDRNVRRILTHSRLWAMKNIDTVIRGFSQFSSSSPVQCELHVVGDGPNKKQLETLAREIGVGKSVHFHGYLPSDGLQRIYEICDVFALLALDEPFGMVYPEAAARGLLLVGPDHGGPMEILDGGRLGWNIDAFSPEALCQALEQIWSLDDAEVDRRRMAADQACRSRFSIATIGPQLLELIR